ncbi:MAG: hypothetical protein QOJ35_2216 [Solirubrobacteraceae bacterium]|nr:hypothetical protein [Solirubrobacteraceae bacterium]
MKAPVKRKKTVKKKVVCKRTRIKGTKRYRKVCKPVKKKKKVVRRPATSVAAPVSGAPTPTPSAAAPPVTTPPSQDPIPDPPVDPPPASGLPVYGGTFGVREAQRLLWRAGFGPRPGDAEALAQQGLVAAVRSLTRPSQSANLVGAPVALPDGVPLAPTDAWGHDHLWWLDRMVRSDQPLVERMTLILHDWFANSRADVDAGLMLAQNEVLRSHALGSFTDLVRDLTVDPAMLVFLSGISNRRNAVNENYGRELMELFTLGADRGAYTETDVRELARALSGWTADWQDPDGYVNFRFVSSRADIGTKSLWAGKPYARSGAFDYRDVTSLVLDNPFHRSFFVLKLWSYFVPSPPSAATQAALEELYDSSGRSIGVLVEAILLHPDVYLGAPLVKPPAVYNAGLLRATGQTITSDAWVWLGSLSGQQLFYPPNVSGWNDRAWLDTSRLYGRWYMANQVLLAAQRTAAHYSGSTETGTQALAAAIAHVGQPALTPETTAVLQALADQPAPVGTDMASYRALRQNALRILVATSPDFEVC